MVRKSAGNTLRREIPGTPHVNDDVVYIHQEKIKDTSEQQSRIIHDCILIDITISASIFIKDHRWGPEINHLII